MCTFNMELQLPDNFPVSPILAERVEYDADIHDINTLLIDICRELANSEHINFVVSGFGQDKWPVDVAVDLCCAVEEALEIVNKIGLQQFDFELYFYEQGIERKLVFRAIDHIHVMVCCKSYTNWLPVPECIEMEKNTISIMLANFILQFIAAAKLCCPQIYYHPWFIEWKNKIEVAMQKLKRA